MLPSLPFDVVLFDIGGVLLTNSWGVHQRAAVAAEFHLDEKELEARHFDIFEVWERGGITMGAYLEFTVFHEPRSFTHDEFVTAMLDQSKLLPNGAIGILRELSASGDYLMGALNNEARELNDYRFKAFDLRDCFDIKLSSCFIGLRKPDPAMYQRAIDIVARPPARILFIDDRPENVAGARNAGMVALQFTSEAELRQQLAEMGTLARTAD